jgi:predicted nucleic acid-binding protein
MPGVRSIHYWDTCLFIAWTKDEARKIGEMDGVREIIDRVKKREVIILTSVITSVEVLQSSLPAGVPKIFQGLMKKVEQKSVDIKIANLVHDLRDYYKMRSAEFDGKILSVPDAIHLATAIIYRAAELNTFDASNARNTLGLLPLSGNVAGHALTICKPVARNPELDLRRLPESKRNAREAE